MNEDSKGVILFLLAFAGLMLAVDGFNGFNFTRGLIGLRAYKCDDRVYTREEGFYLSDNPDKQFLENKEYLKCGYKNRKGEWEEVSFQPLEEQLDGPECHFSGKFKYCE